MPAGPRIRGNNSFGVTTDNPLTAGATTFNSAGLATLPVVSSAHAVIVLDPKRVNGEPEIVVVTSHSSLATVATITRGQYGTVARSHPAGTPWAHVPIDEDYIEILTSATRPSNPYEGQFIFETDTNKLVGYGGVDWAPRDAGGVLGYAQNTATGLVTSGATEVDIPLLTTTVTVGTGRRIKVSGKAIFQGSVALDNFDVRVYRDGIRIQIDIFTFPGASTIVTFYPHVIESPTAGAHTYKLTAVRRGGTGTGTLIIAADAPSYIMVEDIGAA